MSLKLCGDLKVNGLPKYTASHCSHCIKSFWFTFKAVKEKIKIFETRDFCFWILIPFMYVFRKIKQIRDLCFYFIFHKIAAEYLKFESK